MKSWHLYLVRTCDGSLYTGIAVDVRRRVAEHEQGRGKGAKYLRGRGPLRLVFERRLGSRGLALKAEYRVKRMSKPNKETLVEHGPDARQLLAMLSIEDDGKPGLS